MYPESKNMQHSAKTNTLIASMHHCQTNVYSTTNVLYINSNASS